MIEWLRKVGDTWLAMVPQQATTYFLILSVPVSNSGRIVCEKQYSASY